jgi:hypothetical protein
MPDVRESVVFAALAVIIISIPSASQTVEIEEDEYRGVIESEFSDHFQVDFDTGKIFTEAISGDSKLEINKSFRKKTVELQTSQGFIRKERTNDSIVKSVQTPYGKFKSGVRKGENFSEFDGGNRAKAENIREELEKRLEEKMGEAEEKRQIVVSRILPDVELSVEYNHDTEHFNLTNQGEETVDLEGWTVVSEGSSRDTLQLDGELGPDETRTYRGSAGEVGFSDQDSDLTIYSGEGEVELLTSEERIVDSIEY